MAAFSMGTTSGTNVPIEHLDYDYVSKCNNATEVEKILKVLRSNSEGYYPELIKHTEERLRVLKPDSKLLVISQKAKRVADLPKEEWREVTTDIQNWEHIIAGEDTSLLSSSNHVNGDESIADVDLPPVRSGGTVFGTVVMNTRKTKDNQKPRQQPIQSFDFPSWDKYNADEAAAKVDSEDENKEETKKPDASPLPAELSERELGVSDAERERNSIREKEKGNEAFKSADYQEAMVYYTRSIQFKPSAAAYNNRALIAIKLDKYPEAVKDCTEVLKMEPTNAKALVRRATAYQALKDYKEAKVDLDQALLLEPANKRAQELLTKVTASYLPEENLNGGSDKKKGKRITIEEVDEEGKGVSKSDSPLAVSSSFTVRNSAAQQASQPTFSPPPTPPLPPHVQKLKDDGNQLFKAGQYGAAVECYNKAVHLLTKAGTRHNMSIVTLLNNRAACNLKIGDCHQCIADCSQSLSLSPINIKAIMRRAYAYETLEKYGHAYSDYHLALKIDHSLAIAHTACTRMHKYLLDQHGSNWRERLPVNPDSERVVAALSALSAMGLTPDPSRASVPPVVTSTAASSSFSETSVTQSTSVTPTVTVDKEDAGEVASDSKIGKFEMLKVQGNALVKKGDYLTAIDCYTECIQLLPNEVVPYTNRALCYLKLSKYTDAESDCSKCLELQESNVKGLYRRALARKELGMYSEAMRDLKKLLEVDPDNNAGVKEESIVKELWTRKLRDIQQKQHAKTSSGKSAKKVDKKSEGIKPPAVGTVSGQQSKSSSVKEGKKERKGEKRKDSREERRKDAKLTGAEGKSGQHTKSSSPINSATKEESRRKDSKQEKEDMSSSAIGTVSEQLAHTAKENTKTKKRKRVVVEEVDGTAEEKPKEEKVDTNEGRVAGSTGSSEMASEKLEDEVNSEERAEHGDENRGEPESAKLADIKLEKLRVFDYIQMWNSMPRSASTLDYARLLLQIPPSSLPEVISNKLDGHVLSAIIAALYHHITKEGLYEAAYEILSALSRVQRFTTITMFLSSTDKKSLEVMFASLSTHLSSQNTLQAVKKLRSTYLY